MPSKVCFAPIWHKSVPPRAIASHFSCTASQNGRWGACRCAVACFWVPPFIRHAPVSASLGVAHSRPLAGTSLRSCAHSLRSLRGFPSKRCAFLRRIWRPLLWEQLSRANRVRFCPSAFRVASLHQFITAFQPMQVAFKKPVVSSSYSQSAAFAALASYSPSSGVQSKTRTSVHRDARTRPGRDIVTL